MGDMLTLIEKAEEVYEKDEAEAAAAKLLEGEFTLDDFLDQMQQVKKMGSLDGHRSSMLPGMPKELRDAEIDDEEIGRIEAIIHSMTLEERRAPELIDGVAPHPHRQRLGHDARARSTALIKQFQEMQKMMKRMGGFGSKRMAKKKRKNAKAPARAARQAAPKGGGRVTAKGRPPLRLPDLDPASLGAGPGLADLSELPTWATCRT